MNYIAFDPTNLSGEKLEWWSKWCAKAEKATAKVIQQSNGEKIEFNSAIWSELKCWLLENVFNGKCAYCESIVTVTDYGDADHYRPKAGISEVPDHDGYYWVAYDWHNLLPSCSHCNTGGKGTRFPIAGRRVFSREEAANSSVLDAIEKPLLLHPYKNGEDHPMKHLIFNEFGYVAARNVSEKGLASIKGYNLCRKELRKERRACYKNAWRDYGLLIMIGAPREERQVFLKTFLDGTEKHSAAVLNYINQKIEEVYGDRLLCRASDR
jgi:hypothetical protein